MYIRTSKRTGSRNARFISLIVGGIVVVIAIFQFFAPHFIPAVVTTIIRPFWRMEFSVMNGSLKSPDELLAENQALQIRIQELIAENASTNSIKDENTQLLTLFGRKNPVSSVAISTTSAMQIATSTNPTSTSTSSNFSTITNSISPLGSRILGAILARPPLAPYDELIVDIGSNEGVMLGSPVFAPGNILIGTTTDVLGETSKVTLLSSPGQSYPVLIGSTHIPATAVGRGGGQYEAQIPQATQIAVGDSVSDGSLSDGTFGTVTAVLNNPSNPFETILFSPPINIYQLRFVEVTIAIPQNQSVSKYVVPSPVKSKK